jgi:hypothetical protein
MPIVIGLVVIALVIFVVYLYYLLCRWLIVVVGPNAFYVLSVGLTLVVPIVYGRSLFRVFGQDFGASRAARWRNLALVPVVGLLGLAYFDYAYVGIVLGSGFLETPLSREMQDLLAIVVLKSHLNQEVMRWVVNVFPGDTPWWVLILGSASAKSLLIVPCALIARGLGSNELGTLQPAYLSYFHKEAFVDLRRMFDLSTKDLVFAFKQVAKGIAVVTTGPQAIAVWPLAAIAFLSMAPPLIVSLISLATLLTLHALSLGVVWFVAMVLSAILYSVERAVVLARAGYAKCPHKGCHEPIPLPTFECPDCGLRHDRLQPGRHGVLRRQCRCGRHLPTLFWLGKGKLPSLCNHCERPMLDELYGGSIHVPIYGGPSSGKTMFLTAGTHGLMAGEVEGLDVDLIDPIARRDWSTKWCPEFEQGIKRLKTSEEHPDAFLLSVRRRFGLPISLYFYDPAGEALESDEHLASHNFIRYFDGLVLLLDPLSIGSFAEEYREAGGPDLQLTTSKTDPSEVINHVVNVLETHANLSRSKGFKRRVAVVLAKADIPHFASTAGIALSDDAPEGRWRDWGEEQSELLRTWLKKHDSALVQLLETRFADIRYFAASAQGHEPRPGVPFTPRQTLDPLGWLLSRRKVLSRPLLARIGGRMAEGAAVLLTLALWLAVPVVGLAAFGALVGQESVAAEEAEPVQAPPSTGFEVASAAASAPADLPMASAPASSPAPSTPVASPSPVAIQPTRTTPAPTPTPAPPAVSDASGLAIVQSARLPQWVICAGAFPTQDDAERQARRLKEKGLPAGVLWIPDYQSLSGARMWLTFSGLVPYADKAGARALLGRTRPHARGAYGLKLAHAPGRVEL